MLAGLLLRLAAELLGLRTHCAKDLGHPSTEVTVDVRRPPLRLLGGCGFAGELDDLPLEDVDPLSDLSEILAYLGRREASEHDGEFLRPDRIRGYRGQHLPIGKGNGHELARGVVHGLHLTSS